MNRRQIVISIDTVDYEYIKNGCITPIKIDNHIYDAIRNGTPLPKGHGRIGDLDALREEVYAWGMNDYEPSDFVDAIDEAPTIIEADKEGE